MAAAAVARVPKAKVAQKYPQARFWCFTKFVIEPIVFVPETMHFLIYQEEESPSTKKHHLQGVVHTKDKTRTAKVKEILGGDKTVHLEVMRGTFAQAVAYCKKADSRVPGGLVLEAGIMDVKAGQRTDLLDVKRKIQEGKTPVDLRWDDSTTEISAKYQRHIDTMFSDLREKKAKETLEAEAADMVLRPWQDYVSGLMQTDPDDRTVFWVYDEKGGAGKTILGNYLVGNDGAVVLTPGRVTDMAYIWSQNYLNTAILVFDCSRSMAKELGQRDPLQGCLELAEAVKNRRVTSTKYISKICLGQPCHVLFLANRLPDYRKLSEDRWTILTVEDGVLTCCKVKSNKLEECALPRLD